MKPLLFLARLVSAAVRCQLDDQGSEKTWVIALLAESRQLTAPRPAMREFNPLVTFFSSSGLDKGQLLLTVQVRHILTLAIKGDQASFLCVAAWGGSGKCPYLV